VYAFYRCLLFWLLPLYTIPDSFAVFLIALPCIICLFHCLCRTILVPLPGLLFSFTHSFFETKSWNIQHNKLKPIRPPRPPHPPKSGGVIMWWLCFVHHVLCSIYTLTSNYELACLMMAYIFHAVSCVRKKSTKAFDIAYFLAFAYSCTTNILYCVVLHFDAELILSLCWFEPRIGQWRSYLPHNQQLFRWFQHNVTSRP
jgi:hypothetical protein